MQNEKNNWQKTLRAQTCSEAEKGLSVFAERDELRKINKVT